MDGDGNEVARSGTATGTDGKAEGMNRRTVLKGISGVGAGMVGASAATQDAEAGAITGGCVVDWPDAKEDRINIADGTPTEKGSVPDSGDIVIFVHGLFGQDILDSVDINGANQAEAFDQALTERGIDTPVVAGMWNSTTTWSKAKSRADLAGKALAQWVEENYDAFDSIKVLGHSLGSRVTLQALEELADSDASITSAGLLGAGVNPDVVCDTYERGIEDSVEDAVYNYHSEGDRVVCYAYGILEFTSGLGCRGTDCDGGWWFSSADKPDNLIDVDLSGTVEGHCNFYKPESMDFKGQSGIPDVVDHQFEGEGESHEGDSDTLEATSSSASGETDDQDCWLFC